MKNSILILILFAASLPILNAQVTFSEHIAPIIYENCTSCHRPGEIAPFSLTNYEEVANWSNMIRYVTEIKYMPPWKPDRSYSRFVGESGLTDEEIELIAEWVESGSPQGNPSLEPPIPSFPSGSQLGTPDLVLKMDEVYFIEGNNTDDYRVFVLPTGLTEDKEIAAIEFR
ncbi:MAG: cytochrome c, partial [Bacteroidota bacterium]